MSKGQILLGKQRGKVGGFVARVDSGVGQILSEYNPHPKNPRTLAQTTQRAKMNLAGQISKTTPRELIAGMNPNGRKARSMFVSNIIKNAVISSDNVNAVEIDFTSVKYSKGVSIAIPLAAAYDSEHNKVNATPDFSDTPENCTGAMVICVVSLNNVEAGPAAVYTNYALVEKSETPSAASFDVPEGLAGQSAANIYVVPLLNTATGVVVNWGALLTSNAVYQAEFLRSLAIAGGYGESQWMADVNIA